jgi:hypothetical protein
MLLHRRLEIAARTDGGRRKEALECGARVISSGALVSRRASMMRSTLGQQRQMASPKW